ncbi:MAG: Fic family protein [bacterium]
MLYLLEKPQKTSDEKNLDLLSKFSQKDLDEFFKTTSYPEYLYWDKIKYKKPLPQGISTPEDYWPLIKFFRKIQSYETVIRNEYNIYFRITKLPEVEKFFHDVDFETGGNLFLSNKDIDGSIKNNFISRGVMEEAIASSQLEGAHTTRSMAKKFLRENRKPQNKSEQMILNNYKTMQLVESDYKKKELSREMLFELHSLITKDTLADDGTIPRLRIKKDNINVMDETGIIYHQSPKIDFVEKEIDRLIDFANDKIDEQTFTHPVIKAVLLHFWIGYLHPFTDGNGRLARTLFYWYLLKNGYWAFAYLPISIIIKKSPAQYGMSFVYSEQDDSDLTYFIDYNIRKIKLAMSEFEKYVKEKETESRSINNKAKSKYHLNERQIKLLRYYYKNKDEKTSLKLHININQISKMTAIKDLKTLESFGFIVAEKIGRNIHYYATDKINELFK